MFDPIILNDVFDKKDFKKLKSFIEENQNNLIFDTRSHRLDLQHEILNTYFCKKLEPLAKEIFKDKTLKTTYTHYSKYNHPLSNLIRHKDINACTYTIDLCISANTPWGIWIENKEYVLSPGQAIAFLGEEQEHWRGPFPDPYDNVVEMIFFHFAPEDHWFFTHGPQYKQELERLANIKNDHLKLGYLSKDYSEWLKEIEGL